MSADRLIVDSPTVAAHRLALRSLRRRWLLTATVYAVVLAAVYRWLDAAWSPRLAVGWLGWAAVVLVVELAILWWALPHNTPPDGHSLLPKFGYGTALTLTCGLLLMLLAGFLFAPLPPAALGWLPALLYTLARLVDYVDGYVARLTRYETKLGSILDMEFDGLGVLIAVLLAIGYGHLPLWYLPLAFSRQLFIFGIWLRRRRGMPVYEMTPSANRRIIAGYQTGFLSVTLWPSFTPPAATLAALIFGGVLAASFVRDWLVVSGAIDPASAAYRRARTSAKTLVEGWLPTVSRGVGFLVLAGLLVREIPAFPTWLPHLARTAAPWGHPPLGAPAALVWLAAGLGVVAALPFLLGVLGRVAALGAATVGWLDMAANGLDWDGGALLFVAAVIVAHAGSGRWALWQPEEALLQRRPGERPAGGS
jgi:CDP-diacylglycerol--glycerol-3-phosphate 3-phosphatidyltransferase